MMRFSSRRRDIHHCIFTLKALRPSLFPVAGIAHMADFEAAAREGRSSNLAGASKSGVVDITGAPLDIREQKKAYVAPDPPGLRGRSPSLFGD
jgi:hypothetical protein